jgi:hypothetical protein
MKRGPLTRIGENYESVTSADVGLSESDALELSKQRSVVELRIMWPGLNDTVDYREERRSLYVVDGRVAHAAFC